MSNGNSAEQTQDPLQSYLQGGGWEGLRKAMAPPDPKKADAAKEQQPDTDRMTAELFGSALGQRWLRLYLKPITVDQPCFIMGQGNEFGWMREGQNSIYRDIIRRVHRAQDAGDPIRQQKRRASKKPAVVE